MASPVSISEVPKPYVHTPLWTEYSGYNKNQLCGNTLTSIPAHNCYMVHNNYELVSQVCFHFFEIPRFYVPILSGN
jgi:hypothetical protein